MTMEVLHRVLVVGVLLVSQPFGAGAKGTGDGIGHADDTRARAEGIVGRIQRADFTGDRDALRRLDGELASLPSPDAHLGTLLLYWRGFARWRSAINGFNDGESLEAIDADLNAAVSAFEDARRADPGFADAAIGLASSLGYLMYLHRDDAARVRELVARVSPLVKEAEGKAPDHARLIWVLGPSRWNAPRDAEPGDAASRQTGVIASYERALAAIRRQPAPADPLVPAWGEPELLMSLAWSHLNKAEPDAAAAERYATEALALAPDWHYLRDILMPQIRKAGRGRP